MKIQVGDEVDYKDIETSIEHLHHEVVAILIDGLNPVDELEILPGDLIVVECEERNAIVYPSQLTAVYHYD